MAVHALLSASASHRWIECPPSARKCAEVADTASEYALQGTDAHALCEYKVLKYLGKRVKNPAKKLRYYDQEMEDCSDVYIEIPKKNGKSELAAAVALYLLFADGEAAPEVYGAAADRQQAAIVFDVANQMVKLTPALSKRSKSLGANKRIVSHLNNGFYQVLSAEVGTKHGLNVSGLVLDEVHG